MKKHQQLVEDTEQTKFRRQKWADYYRLRVRPKKVCTRCLVEKPNNQEHFQLGKRGRITGVCLLCAPMFVKQMPAVKGECPICDEVQMLVRDLRAPPGPTVRMCRACLVVVHALTRTPKRYERLTIYAKWSMDYRGSLGSLPPHSSTPLEVPVDEDDDDPSTSAQGVTDPVGEPDPSASAQDYPEVEATPLTQTHDTYDCTGE